MRIKGATLLAMMLLILAGCAGETTHDEPELLPYIEGRRWGFMDNQGVVVIEPTYQMAEAYIEGHARVMYQNAWGYLDGRGEMVINNDWVDARRFSEGLAGVSDGGGWGFIDKSGDLVIPIRYDYVISFSEGLASVKVATKYGFIDNTSTMVIEPRFLNATSFKGGMARVTEDNVSWYFIDKTGKQVGEPYEKIEDFSEGLGAVMKYEEWGFIDTSGNVVIELQYGAAYAFSDGRAVVGYPLRGEWSIIDKEGAVVVEPGTYAFIRSYREGYAAVRTDASWGFIDSEGNVVIEPQDQRAVKDFSDGLAPFRVGDKWGVLDKQGEVLVEPTYDEVIGYHHGVSMVRQGRSRSYIDKNGELLREFK